MNILINQINDIGPKHLSKVRIRCYEVLDVNDFTEKTSNSSPNRACEIFVLMAPIHCFSR